MTLESQTGLSGAGDHAGRAHKKSRASLLMEYVRVCCPQPCALPSEERQAQWWFLALQRHAAPMGSSAPSPPPTPPPAPPLPEGSLRLVPPPGVASDRGRLEVWISGAWGAVCDPG